MMDTLSHAKMILDTVYFKNQEILLANAVNIQQVIDFMNDTESKINYKKEIIFKALAPITGVNTAQRLSKSGISEADFAALCQKAATDHNLPQIACHGTGYNYKNYFLATTFYLSQYQYRDIVKVRQNDVFFDCGACCGDTTLWAKMQGAGKTVSFEIDRKNLECIHSTFQMNHLQDVTVVDQAVGREKGVLFYTPSPSNPGAGVVSAQKTDEGYEVSLTSLDDYAESSSIYPDFIKMDIEGAEHDALFGARKCITEYRPDLAICLYHRIQDMWELPLIIKSFCPEYRFYCKKSHPAVEFVLLATCRGDRKR